MHTHTRTHVLSAYTYLSVHRLLDNLPAATVFTNIDTGEKQYEDGFRVGFVTDDRLLLNNHLHFIVDYHSVPDEEGKGEVHRIVGFEVVTQRWVEQGGRGSLQIIYL